MHLCSPSTTTLININPSSATPWILKQIPINNDHEKRIRRQKVKHSRAFWHQNVVSAVSRTRFFPRVRFSNLICRYEYLILRVLFGNYFRWGGRFRRNPQNQLCERTSIEFGNFGAGQLSKLTLWRLELN